MIFKEKLNEGIDLLARCLKIGLDKSPLCTEPAPFGVLAVVTYG
jgi:hypothetical protein